MASSSVPLPGGLPGMPPVPPVVMRAVSELEGVTGPLVLNHPFAGSTWVAVGDREVVHVAADDDARVRLRLERLRMEWARDHGVPVPRVVSATDDVLMTARVPQDVPRGSAFTSEAIRIADLITAAGPLPAALVEGGTTWRAPRRTVVPRFLRGLRARLDWREFLDVRRRAFGLAADTMSHGDYHGANLLFDSAAGSIVLIDWEYAGLAAHGTDLLTLWPQTLEEQDRAVLLDAALSRSRDRTATAVLHHWLAVRWFAEVATGSPTARLEPDKIERARRRVREARANAAAWTS